MTEAQWLSPPAENELANRIAVCVDEETRRLTFLKREYEAFEIFAENADYLDEDLNELLRGAYQDKIDALTEHIQEMNDNLERMGVVA